MNAPPPPTAPLWTPPHDADLLITLLVRLRAWSPLDLDVVLDDVADALDEVAPPPKSLPQLAGRLGSHIEQLRNIALAAPGGHSDRYLSGLVNDLGRCRDRGLPHDVAEARLHVQHLARTTAELIDRLIATRRMKGSS